MHPATVCVFGALLLAAVQAAPQFQFAPAAPAVAPVATLDRHEVVDDAGQYSITYTTQDGIQVTKQGVLKPTKDGSDLVIVEQGKYRYVTPEGTVVELQYTADENGFHPESASIPVQGVAHQPAFI